MNAISELKAMLDERGVKYRDNVYSCNTQWESLKGGAAHASQCKYDESLLKLTAYTVTPEQAIDATLGREECEPVATDCYDGLLPPFTVHCSACGDEWGFTPNYCPHCGRKVR